jgi:hypothetical protein
MARSYEGHSLRAQFSGAATTFSVSPLLRFAPGFVRPHEARLREIARERGDVIAGGSFTVSFDQGQLEWRFVAVAVDVQKVRGSATWLMSWRSWKGWRSFRWPMRATDGWAIGCPAN